jgi:hypothetical protein
VALALWMMMRGGATWPWREGWEVANMTLPGHLRDMWFRLPDTVRKPLLVSRLKKLPSAHKRTPGGVVTGIFTSKTQDFLLPKAPSGRKKWCRRRR